VLLADHALAEHLELVAEHRLRKTLSPDLMVEQLREPRSRYAGSSEPSVSTARASCAGESSSPATLRSLREGAKSAARSVGPLQRHARRSAGASQLALRDEIQRVAQMQTRNGPARAADLAGAGRAKATVGRWWRSFDAPGEDVRPRPGARSGRTG